MTDRITVTAPGPDLCGVRITVQNGRKASVIDLDPDAARDVAEVISEVASIPEKVPEPSR